MAVRFFPLIVFLFALLVPVGLHAQPTINTKGDGGEVVAAGQGVNPDSDPTAWIRILDSTEQAISRDGVTDSDLDRLFDESGSVRDSAAVEIQKLQGKVNGLKRQLDELGKPPADGEPAETEEVQKRREVLNSEFAQSDAELKRAKIAEVRAGQLRKAIADLRHSRFIQSISVRTKGLSTPTFWGEFAAGFGGFFKSFKLLVGDSATVFFSSLASETRIKVLLPVILFLLGIVALRLQGFLRDLLQNPESTLSSERAGNAVSGFVYFLKNGVVGGFLPYMVYRVLSEMGALTLRLDTLLHDVLIAVGFLIAILALFHVLLAPGHPARRIVKIDDAAAAKIFSILSTGVTLAVFVFAVNQTAVILVSPLEVNVGLSLIFSLLVGGSSLFALYEYRSERKRSLRHGDPVQLAVGIWAYVLALMWIVAVLIIGAALTGFVAFAEFLSQQLIFGWVVVLSGWLLLQFIDYVFSRFSAESIAATSQTNAATADLPASGQTIILGAGVLKLIVYCIAGMLLLLPWGYRTADFYFIFREVFFGVEVGGLTISISTILLAIVIFFVGYTATVALRNWLNNKFLPTTKFDIGISNSISTVFGYIGFVLAAVLAISAAGFDMSNLAIVAGALSVGVGFGLQSIVNNFVSGLILLAERPIKAGDWIVTAGGEGYVRKISVRSTEIETFDRATVIVPNSTLITDTVTNWTHETKSGRIILPIGVGYDSDPDKVEEVLLKCAEDQKMILSRPAPVVYFVDFGASSLDFQLRCYLSDINYSLSVKSELRFRILRALRAANIEIPFPQRDVNIRSNPAAVESVKSKRKTVSRRKPARPRKDSV